MKYIRILACILFLFACGKENTEKPPKVINGVLDLSTWDFEKNRIVNLEGDWEFYWKEIFYSEDFQNPEKLEQIAKLRNTFPVPSSWNQFILPGSSEKIGGIGYATYRVLIKIPPNTKSIGLKLFSILTSYRLYINGVLYTQEGIPGKSSEESKPFMHPKVLRIADPNSSNLELLVHVSNFSHLNGGLNSQIQLGKETDLHLLRQKSIGIDLFLFGSLFIMSVYHFGLFWIRKKDKSTLYFSIFSFLLAIRALVTYEKYFLEYTTSIPWEISSKVEFLTIYSSTPFVILFLHLLFPDEFKKIITKTIVFLSLFLSGIVLLTPPIFFSKTLIFMQSIILFCCIYSVISVIKAVLHYRIGSKSFFWGSLFLSMTIVNDILYEKEIIYTGHYVPFGLFVFIFSQAYLLSVRFSNAFKEEEKARNFAEEQSSLVAKAKMEIEKLSKTKDEFLANLSHELKTPLSVVYAYSEMLRQNKDNPSKIEKYSEKIFSNAEKLNTYVSDLILVTDIESNLQLQKAKTDLLKLIEDSLLNLKSLQEEKNTKIDFSQSENYFINCDPILMTKAISAILKNAIVYNVQNGSVEIFFQSKSDSEILIQIQDTGIGIPQDLHQKVFEKFFRVDSSINYEVSGVGIGLFLAKKIIELHSGKLEIQSEIGKGSTFSILLPSVSK